MKLKNIKIGVFSFVIVLLFMPLGHALMVLNEKIFLEHKFIGAGVIGFLGVALLVISLSKERKKSTATLLGLLAGILVWTGWVEFSFVWIAEKLNIPALYENSEIATRPEYLIMPSSIGILGTFFLLYLFTSNRCQFFVWFQKIFRIRNLLKTNTSGSEKPVAISIFIETIMILWTFYILLLLVYDKDIAGDKHLFTYIVAFGSLFWSIYLFFKLIKITNFDYAIRYAVPTVIIFWNFVEVMGRWNLFKEIWIHPFEYWVQILAITIVLILFIMYYIFENRKIKTQTL